MAISAQYLAANPVYHDGVGQLRFVVLTDASGANRVYQTEGANFVRWDGEHTVVDEQGGSWQLGEAQLTASDGRILYRLPAHRAFWFGWFSAYSHTRLIK